MTRQYSHNKTSLYCMFAQKKQHKEIVCKTRFLLVCVYLCVLVFQISCNSEKNGIPEFQPDTSVMDPISKNLVARIYFDASASMQGFVVPSSSQYKNILRPLESVITIGWKNGKSEFFRFGEKVTPIIDRDSYLMADSEDFYTELRTYIQKIFEFEFEEQLVGENTEINNVSDDSIDDNTTPNDVNSNGKENSLVVIVTDLFQDRQDVNLLVSQLRDKYIRKEQALGLLGLRSEFDGRVYNLGTAPIIYRSAPGKSETFRPFYLLVIGKHADISHYFDRIKANGFPEAQSIIFSRYLVNPLLSFGGTENKTEKENLNIRNINSYERQNPHLKQYEIVNSSDPAKISTKIPYIPLPHAKTFNVDTFEISIIAKCSDEGETKISKDAQECLKVTSTLSKNDNGNAELNVEFSLDSQSLKRKAVYLYEVTLRPNVNTFQAPEWCLEWDMGDERNGARTLNLVNFVQDLSLVTARIHRPKIATFHCYIKKR